jgi:hypothetical protein
MRVQVSVGNLKSSWESLEVGGNINLGTTDYPENYRVAPTLGFASLVQTLDPTKTRVVQVLYKGHDTLYIAGLNIEEQAGEWKIASSPQLIPRWADSFNRF